jgi:hypothetical protein
MGFLGRGPGYSKHEIQIQIQIAYHNQLECYRLALGACSPVFVSSDMYEGTFAKKQNRVRGLPAPPAAPRSWVLGSLVWRAEGLPSAARAIGPSGVAPATATHQPDPGDTCKAM